MTLYLRPSMSAGARNYARAMSILLLVSFGAVAAEPDAPKVVDLTPTAHEARVNEAVCKKDLADCQSADKVAFKWVIVGVASGVAAGIVIGLAAGLAAKR